MEWKYRQILTANCSGWILKQVAAREKFIVPDVTAPERLLQLRVLGPNQ